MIEVYSYDSSTFLGFLSKKTTLRLIDKAKVAWVRKNHSVCLIKEGREHDQRSISRSAKKL